MPSRYYDAVVLGRSLGALTTAALLSRRDFRVLVLGQGQRGQTYRFEGRVLCRRSFTLLGASSPAFRRVLQELAQSPQFRRRTQSLDPMDFSVHFHQIDCRSRRHGSVVRLICSPINSMSSQRRMPVRLKSRSF